MKSKPNQTMSKPRGFRPTKLTHVLVVAASLFSHMTGCDIEQDSDPITFEELIGRYEPTYECGGKERIILFADSTYIHTFEYSPSKSKFLEDMTIYSGRNPLIFNEDNDSLRVRYFPPDTAASFSQVGRWSLYVGISDNQPHVRFKDFQHWYPLEGNCATLLGPRTRYDTIPRGWMPYLYKSGDGPIWIKRCPNYGEYYVKKN